MPVFLIYKHIVCLKVKVHNSLYLLIPFFSVIKLNTAF